MRPVKSLQRRENDTSSSRWRDLSRRTQEHISRSAGNPLRYDQVAPSRDARFDVKSQLMNLAGLREVGPAKKAKALYVFWAVSYDDVGTRYIITVGALRPNPR